MKRVRKLTSSGGAMSEVLKKLADSQVGKARGMTRMAAQATPQAPTSTAPTFRASAFTSG